MVFHLLCNLLRQEHQGQSTSRLPADTSLAHKPSISPLFATLKQPTIVGQHRNDRWRKMEEPDINTLNTQVVQLIVAV